jgi:hypothetical protein
VLFRQTELLPYRKQVAVMSGGNVEPAVLASILGTTAQPAGV